MTPKQQILYNKLLQNPATAELLSRLQCELPVVSEASTKASKISNRIDTLIQIFQTNIDKNSRIKAATPNHSNPFSRQSEISSYLEAIYGPKPWTFPLPFAPF